MVKVPCFYPDEIKCFEAVLANWNYLKGISSNLNVKKHETALHSLTVQQWHCVYEWTAMLHAYSMCTITAGSELKPYTSRIATTKVSVLHTVVWQATPAVLVRLVWWLFLARRYDFCPCILQVKDFNIATYGENSMRSHLSAHSETIFLICQNG